MSHHTQPTSTTTDQPAGDDRSRREPLVFGGLTEHEGWAVAPITPRDRVHFRADRELPLATFRAALPVGVTVTYD